jgi:hypothetical protein
MITLPSTLTTLDQQHGYRSTGPPNGSPSDPMIDTSDMLFAHRLFRRELRNAPELIGGVAAGDTKRSA